MFWALSLVLPPGSKSFPRPQNPTLEVQDQRGLSFQQFGAVKAQLLQTISDGPAAPAAASSPATMTLAPAAPLLPPLYGQTEEESDAGYASMRVADGAEVETLSTWQTRGKSNTTHVVHCAQAMGAKVCKNLTLVLNPLSV